MAIIGMVVIALVVLAFVLEPILRARGDVVVLDSVALPELVEPDDDELIDGVEDDEILDAEPGADDRATAGRMTIDRAASSDAS
jgi:hypothetical protein